MFKKGSKLYSIFSGTCPKCHEESMYVNKNPYILSEALSMNETCSNCNTKYKNIIKASVKNKVAYNKSGYCKGNTNTVTYVHGAIEKGWFYFIFLYLL